MRKFFANYYGAIAALTAAKLLLVFSLNYSGHATVFVGDNARAHYVPIAERLISAGSFNGAASRPDSKVPPGYPVVLAAAKIVADHAGFKYLLGICCVQILADFAVSVLLFRLGRVVGSPSAGRLAGLLWQVYPAAVVFSCWITAENLFTLLGLLSFTLLVTSIEKPTSSLTWVAGVTLGLATMFRATCLWLPVFMLPLFWFSRHIPKGRAKAIAFLFGTWSVVLPWAARNAIVLGDPILASTGSGSVFMQGSDERVFTIAGKTRWYPVMYQAASEHGISRPADDRESKADGLMFEIGLFNYRNRLEKSPLSFVPFFLKKVLRLWYATESGGRTQQLILGLGSLAIVPLGFWGAWKLACEKPSIARAFSWIVAYFVLVHVITLPLYRYIHPVVPLILLTASYSLLGLHDSFRSSQGKAMDCEPSHD